MICAIRHAHGWAITDDCIKDIEKHLIIEDGKKIAKSSLALKLNNIFEVRGVLTVGEPVECIVKTEAGEKLCFAGTVKIRGKQVTTIHELIKIDLYDQILTKLKQ